jgi:hypothetical protein
MKEIMQALCREWKAEWQGLVMAELRYERGAGVAASYEINIKEGRMVRVAASAETGERMSMILLPLKKGKSDGTREAEGEPWRVFSAEEVRGFSKGLGDHNEIHQGTHPIVSGFQILNALGEVVSAPSLRIRFHHPLYAGEMVSLAKEEGMVKGYAGALCFTYEEMK